ncbi:hypothetical protein BC332_28659 [Capsicum chinense]|nr:hypothetical protein BC332_28659 [Capsicum chinense]
MIKIFSGAASFEKSPVFLCLELASSAVASSLGFVCSQTKAAPVLINNDPSGGISLLQFAFEEFQLLLSEKWIHFVEDISHALFGRLQIESRVLDEAACVLKDKGFEASPLLKEFLDGDMLDPQSMVVRDFASSRPLPLTKERKEMLSDILSRIVEDVYSVLVYCLNDKYLLQLQMKVAHDSGIYSDSGVLPGGVSMRQFAIKEFQKLLSNSMTEACASFFSADFISICIRICKQLLTEWNPCLEDISYALVRELVKQRKCCLQLQFEASWVLTYKGFKGLPLLQKFLDDDMLDLRSIVAPVLPINLQQPVTKKYEVFYEKLNRIVEDMYSDFVELLVSRYLLKLQPDADGIAKESIPIFEHLPVSCQIIQKNLQEVDLVDVQTIGFLLESVDSDMQLLGIKLVEQLFSEGFVSEVKGILRSFVVDVVPLLTHITWKMDSPEVQFKGAWALIHIISYSMIKYGLVEPLLELLEIDSVCEKKIAFNPVSRDHALKCGALLVLLKKLSTSNGSILRKLTLTILNFCEGFIKPPFSQSNLFDDEVVLENACRALCLISGVVDSSGGASEVMGVADIEKKKKKVSQREINDAFYAANVLLVLVKLLKYMSFIKLNWRLYLNHVSLWFAFESQAVFAAGLIEPFCKLVAIKKMGIAAVAIANAIDGTADDEQKKSLVGCCIDVLCNYVGDQNKWTGIGLRGIEKILKLGEAKKANNGDYNDYAQQIKEDVKLEDFWTPRFKSQAKAILMTYWPSAQWPYSKSVSTHTP